VGGGGEGQALLFFFVRWLLALAKNKCA